MPEHDFEKPNINKLTGLPIPHRDRRATIQFSKTDSLASRAGSGSLTNPIFRVNRELFVRGALLTEAVRRTALLREEGL